MYAFFNIKKWKQKEKKRSEKIPGSGVVVAMVGGCYVVGGCYEVVMW